MWIRATYIFYEITSETIVPKAWHYSVCECEAETNKEVDFLLAVFFKKISNSSLSQLTLVRRIGNLQGYEPASL